MNNYPPSLEKTSNGEINIESLANLIDWFLNYDERVAIVRHPHVEAVYQWRQQDAKMNGEEMTPFDRAEDRFAVGIFQALGENNNEASLHNWINNLLTALQEAKELNSQISKEFKLNENLDVSPIAKANNLPTNNERRLYLTAYWIESLCTAEVRLLGWIYQQLYNQVFTP